MVMCWSLLFVIMGFICASKICKYCYVFLGWFKPLVDYQHVFSVLFSLVRLRSFKFRIQCHKRPRIWVPPFLYFQVVFHLCLLLFLRGVWVQEVVWFGFETNIGSIILSHFLFPPQKTKVNIPLIHIKRQQKQHRQTYHWGIPSLVHRRRHGWDGVHRSRKQYEWSCVRVPAISGCHCWGRGWVWRRGSEMKILSQPLTWGPCYGPGQYGGVGKAFIRSRMTKYI